MHVTSVSGGVSRGGENVSESWLTLNGIVERGHLVASRKSEHYPRGTVEMQIPYFKKQGFDLSSLFKATLNISISPHTFSFKKTKYIFRNIRWTDQHPPEDFSFSSCRIEFAGIKYEGWIYYPHPETKKRHFQTQSTIEIIAPYIPNIKYGDRVEVEINTEEIKIEAP